MAQVPVAPARLLPPEGFQRSVVLKGEGGNNTVGGPKEKDPLKSLLKAMGVVKKSAGTKKVEAIAKTDGSPGGPKKFDPHNGRPKRRK